MIYHEPHDTSKTARFTPVVFHYQALSSPLDADQFCQKRSLKIVDECINIFIHVPGRSGVSIEKGFSSPFIYR